MTTDEVRQRVRDLGLWFHNMELAGVQTAPDHFLGDFPNVKWQAFRHHIPQDLRGATVLDVGCNAGFYCLELKRRGADRVVGVDEDQRYLDQARLAADVSGLDIDFRHMSVYDVAELRERFDLVLFLGVLYHLRHPLLALDLLERHVVRDLFIFQSLQRGSPAVTPLKADYPFSEEAVFDDPGYPRMHFVERSYAGDPTNWWIPNRACVEAMLRSSGFRVTGRAQEDIYICRRAPATQEDSRS